MRGLMGLPVGNPEEFVEVEWIDGAFSRHNAKGYATMATVSKTTALVDGIHTTF